LNDDVSRQHHYDGGHRGSVELPGSSRKPPPKWAGKRLRALHDHLGDGMPRVHAEEAKEHANQQQDDDEKEGVTDDGDQRGQDVARLDEDPERVENDDADQEREIEAGCRRNEAANWRQVPLSGHHHDPSGFGIERAGKPGDDGARDQDEDEDRDHRGEQVADAAQHRWLVYGSFHKSRLRISGGAGAPAGRPSDPRVVSLVAAAGRPERPARLRRAHEAASPSLPPAPPLPGPVAVRFARRAGPPGGRSAGGAPRRRERAGSPAPGGFRRSAARPSRSAPAGGTPAKDR